MQKIILDTIEKLVNEVMDRYGKQVFPHAVYGELAFEELGMWKNLKITLKKTFTKALTKSYEAGQKSREKEGWQSFDNAPKDREILVCFPHQGNVIQVVSYNKVHNWWNNNGNPMVGLEKQECLWTDIPSIKFLSLTKELK